MGYEEKAMSAAKPHRLVVEERSRLSVTGVEEVGRFDEDRIELSTSKGRLTILGEGLHIGKLSVDTGELSVEGRVFELSYEDERPYPASGAGFSAEMERPLTEQLVQAGLSLLLGAGIGTAYDFLRAMRRSGASPVPRCAVRSAVLRRAVFCSFRLWTGSRRREPQALHAGLRGRRLGPLWAYSLAVCAGVIRLCGQKAASCLSSPTSEPV